MGSIVFYFNCKGIVNVNVNVNVNGNTNINDNDNDNGNSKTEILVSKGWGRIVGDLWVV